MSTFGNRTLSSLHGRSIEITNWNYELKLRIEITNWNYKLKLRIEITNWNYELKLRIAIPLNFYY